MKEKLNFLIEICKLKEMPRTGWVLAGIKNPETVAEHLFGLAMTAWLLGEKSELNIEKSIKVALAHDLCEVYAGDSTPFFYYPRLPKDEEKRKKVLMKWARLLRKEKEKIGKAKFEKEKKSLLRLIKPLSSGIKEEFFSLWLGYEKGILREGKFVRQLNRIETLLQSIEYFGTKDVKVRTNWWEWVEEIAEDPLLLDFLKVIQKKFYGQVSEGYKKQKELESILDFLFKIGELKRMPRLYWTIWDIKYPETVAGHIFTLTLMAWVFGRRKRPKLNMEKLLKMALCHEISAVYTGDTTPYDKILPKDRKEKRKVLKKWTRLSKKEKTKIFLKDYEEEKKSLKNLTLKLKPSLKKEIIELWKEYRTKSTPEGRFLSQLNVLAVLLQALFYEEKYKKFSAVPIWEWAFEIADDPIIRNLMEEMKKKFYKT